MNQLNKNRLIGGAVLLFAGLLFAPMILTPAPHPLVNPTLAVHIDSDNPQAKPSQSATTVKPAKATAKPTVPTQPSVKLESIDDTVVDNRQAVPSKQPTPANTAAKPLLVVLESAIALDNSKLSATAANNSNTSKGSWVRVASFSSKANADKLVTQLKQKKYSVKTQVTTVDGKSYRRVLVGPFSAENLQSAMKKIRAEGYKPSIQH